MKVLMQEQNQVYNHGGKIRQVQMLWQEAHYYRIAPDLYMSKNCYFLISQE